MTFNQDILAWYDANARSLPWSGERDPYRIWLSEIMLQQTLTETVKGYYTRFLNHFPDVSALAAAPEEAVLKLWEGLGYYSRARNLHAAAKVVSQEMGGAVPKDASARSARCRAIRRERYRVHRLRRMRARSGRQPGAGALPDIGLGTGAAHALRSAGARRSHDEP